jgi:hypothetical protein
MYLLGIPDGVDPKTVKVDSTWPMSARSERVFTQMHEREERARRYCESVSDDTLRAKIIEYDEADARKLVELAELGITPEPQETDDPATLTRDEMIEIIVAGYAGCEPALEAVYPGADDPTVLTIEQARAMPEAQLRERATEIVADTLAYYDRTKLADGLPDDAAAIETMPLDQLFALIEAFAYFFDPAGDHPFPLAQPVAAE